MWREFQRSWFETHTPRQLPKVDMKFIWKHWYFNRRPYGPQAIVPTNKLRCFPQHWLKFISALIFLIFKCFLSNLSKTFQLNFWFSWILARPNDFKLGWKGLSFSRGKCNWHLSLRERFMALFSGSPQVLRKPKWQYKLTCNTSS